MKHLFIPLLLLAFATNAHAQEPATKWSNFNAQIVGGTNDNTNYSNGKLYYCVFLNDYN